jgi:hypothetical protein
MAFATKRGHLNYAWAQVKNPCKFGHGGPIQVEARFVNALQDRSSCVLLFKCMTITTFHVVSYCIDGTTLILY